MTLPRINAPGKWVDVRIIAIDDRLPIYLTCGRLPTVCRLNGISP